CPRGEGTRQARAGWPALRLQPRRPERHGAALRVEAPGGDVFRWVGGAGRRRAARRRGVAALAAAARSHRRADQKSPEGRRVMTLLLELAIKTSIPLAAGLLAALALRKRSAAVRHWVLAAALVCGAGAPVLARLAPSWTLPGLAATAAERRASVDVSFGRLQHSGADAAPSPTMPAVQSPLPARVAMAVVPLWLGGAALNLLVLLVGMSRLSRLRLSPAPLAGSRGAEALRHLAAAFQLRRPIALIRGARPAVIVTWGFLRPKVLLPADADAWPRQRLEVVLAPECGPIAGSG